jgi:hypothetical protein
MVVENETVEAMQNAVSPITNGSTVRLEPGLRDENFINGKTCAAISATVVPLSGPGDNIVNRRFSARDVVSAFRWRILRPRIWIFYENLNSLNDYRYTLPAADARCG